MKLGCENPCLFNLLDTRWSSLERKNKIVCRLYVPSYLLRNQTRYDIQLNKHRSMMAPTQYVALLGLKSDA